MNIAVDNLSLTIHKGEIFGLLGPNGAGKSTLVSMLTTVIKPTSGKIYLNERHLKSSSRHLKRLIGVTPQEIALFEKFTAEENMRFFATLYGLSNNEIKQRSEELIHMVGLSDKKKTRVCDYSGGMKRRLNIAVSLIHSPEVLILDEPTVGVDAQSRNSILEFLYDLNKNNNMTIIYTSHYMEEVEFLCDRIGIMEKGKIISLGSVEELKLSSNTFDYLVLDSTSDININSINLTEIEGVIKVIKEDKKIKLLLVNNADVLKILNIIDSKTNSKFKFSYESVNLETVFLNLTGKALRN